MDWYYDILLLLFNLMNQQTLTSEKENDSYFLESSASRSFSFVFSVPNETVNTPASDVRFVFSNAKPVDIRFFIDEKGEIHSSLRIIPKSVKKENEEISKNKVQKENSMELSEQVEIQHETKDTDQTEIKEEAQIRQVSPKVPKRGRPKGSKNKKSKLVPDKKKFQQEWFETNAEFKARVAEEMKYSQAA